MIIPEGHKKLLNNTLNIGAKDLKLGDNLEKWIKNGGGSGETIQYINGPSSARCNKLFLDSNWTYKIEAEAPEIFNGHMDNTHKMNFTGAKDSLLLTSASNSNVGQKVTVNFSERIIDRNENIDGTVGFFFYIDDPHLLKSGELEIWLQDENNKIIIPTVTERDYVSHYGMYFAGVSRKLGKFKWNKITFVRKTSKPFQIWFSGCIICYNEFKRISHQDNVKYTLQVMASDNNKLLVDDVDISDDPQVLFLPDRLLSVEKSYSTYIFILKSTTIT